MDVVGISDVVFVGDVRDDPEAPLQALGKLVGAALHGCAVKAEADVGHPSPGQALVVQELHHLNGEVMSLGISVTDALHPVHTLAQPGIAQADGAVVIVQQPVDLLTLGKTADRSMLPQDRRDIGGCPQECLVPDHEGFETQLAPLVEQMPELRLIATRAAGHVHQVDGHGTLIEAAVVFVLAILPHALFIRRQKCPTSHAGINVALQLFHHLGADVIRHHAPGGTLRRQLRQIPVMAILGDVVLIEDVDQLGKRRGDPHADLVLDAFMPLPQSFLDNQRQIVPGLALGHFVQIHEHRDERGLSVGGQQRLDLILDRLDASLHFPPNTHLSHTVDLVLRSVPANGEELVLNLPAILLTGHIHKRREVRQADGLPTVGVGGHLRNDLRGDIAGRGEAVRLLDQRVRDDGSVLKHVLQIHQLAVGDGTGDITHVMNVNDSLVVSLHHVLRKDVPPADVLADLGGQVVPHGAVNDWILVGVLLPGDFVVMPEQRQDTLVGGVLLAQLCVAQPVSTVVAHERGPLGGQQFVLDHVLDLLHGHSPTQYVAPLLYPADNKTDHRVRQPVCFHDLGVRRLNRLFDLGIVEWHFPAIPLDDFHKDHLGFCCSSFVRLHLPSRFLQEVFAGLLVIEPALLVQDFVDFPLFVLGQINEVVILIILAVAVHNDRHDAGVEVRIGITVQSEVQIVEPFTVSAIFKHGLEALRFPNHIDDLTQLCRRGQLEFDRRESDRIAKVRLVVTQHVFLLGIDMDGLVKTLPFQAIVLQTHIPNSS